MTINEIIAISKQILEKAAAAPVAAVLAAKKEVAEASGYKATIARAKLRTAEAAVAEHEATLAMLKAQLPTDETRVWFGQHYAEYDAKREAYLATVAALEVQLIEETAVAKKGAWKFARGAQLKEGSGVTSLRTKIAEVAKAIAALDGDNKTIKKIVDEYRVSDAQEAEFQLWLAGGPKPAYLRQRDEAERAEFLRDCTVLKLPTRGAPYTFTLPVEEPEEEEMGEPVEWVTMSAEDYLKSLIPPRHLQEEVVVFKPSTPGRTSRLAARLMAAKAARKAGPMLTVSEVV